jgi:hypothetical protein
LLRFYAIQEGENPAQILLEEDTNKELSDLVMHLLGIDLNSLSPIQALNKLNELQQRAKDQEQ